MATSLNGFYTPMSWGQPASTDYAAALMPNISAPGVTGAGVAGDTSMWDSLQGWLNDSGVLGKTLGDGTKVQGWGGLGLNAASGLMSGWLGMQQLGLAKDAAAQQKKQFQLNYDAQAKTVNTQLEDRQRARVAANPTAYQSVGDYMSKARIGG